MILIAESGATKCDWCLTDGASVVIEFTTKGINAATGSPEETDATLSEALQQVHDVNELHFYGAGLVSDELCSEMAGRLKRFFPDAEIECKSDLVAAARAMFGDKRGIVAILGTGSNSCEYDGNKIIRNVRPGGFILGDEGSASALGQMFLADFIKGFIPESLSDSIAQEYKEIYSEELSYINIVKQVYAGNTPARYMASLVRILAKHRKSKTVCEMLEDNFRGFFERCLSQYDTDNLMVGVAGGFGYEFQDVLVRLGNSYGVSFIKFLKRPMEGLISYHHV